MVATALAAGTVVHVSTGAVPSWVELVAGTPVSSASGVRAEPFSCHGSVSSRRLGGVRVGDHTSIPPIRPRLGGHDPSDLDGDIAVVLDDAHQLGLVRRGS